MLLNYCSPQPIGLILIILKSCHGQPPVGVLSSYENVALNKIATMSSYWGEGSDKKHPAEWAVNGDKSSKFTDHKNCIRSGDNDSRAWWEVDLGQKYPLERFTVWTSLGLASHMENSIVTVDGKNCHKFPSSINTTLAKIDFACLTVVRGRRVRISSSPVARVANSHILTFCEFQVWSCKSRFWGDNCEKDCGYCADDQPCHKIFGNCSRCIPGLKLPLCSQVCDAGKYGQDCKNNCSTNCATRMCNWETGYCPCAEGSEWLPPLCAQRSEDWYNEPWTIASFIFAGLVAFTALLIFFIYIRMMKSSAGEGVEGIELEQTDADEVSTRGTLVLDTKEPKSPLSKPDIEYDTREGTSFPATVMIKSRTEDLQVVNVIAMSQADIKRLKKFSGSSFGNVPGDYWNYNK